MTEDRQEIELRELLHIVRRKWWILVAFVVASVLITGFVTRELIQPVYEAKSTVFIGKETDSIAGISFTDLQLANQLVVDYQELIKTRLVTSEVIESLNLEISESAFVSRLDVRGIRDSRFIHILFRDEDPGLAMQIANSLSQSLVEGAREVVGVENVLIVDEAIVPTRPVSPNLQQNILIAGVLGLLLGFFLILFLHFLDNTIKREEDVERQLELPVLGIVPRFETGEVR